MKFKIKLSNKEYKELLFALMQRRNALENQRKFHESLNDEKAILYIDKKIARIVYIQKSFTSQKLNEKKNKAG